MANVLEGRLPQQLDCSNLAKEWPKWKQQFHIYMIANNKNAEPEQNKIATFLWLIGERGVQIYNTLFPNNGDVESMFGVPAAAAAGANVPAENAPAGAGGNAAGGEENNAGGEPQPQARSLVEVITAFDGYCLPRKNVAMEAFKFNMIVQKEKQSFADFETALRTQLGYCEFECLTCHSSYADRMLRDRIIIGVQDKKLQLKLLDGKDEPLARIVETCKVFEAAAENKQLLDRKTPLTEINAVAEQATQGGNEVAAVKGGPMCYNCGQPYNGRHRRYCPANNVNCDSCGRRGHFMKFCRTSKSSSNNRSSGVSEQGNSHRAAGNQRSNVHRAAAAAASSSKDQRDVNTTVHSVNWADAGNRTGSGESSVETKGFLDYYFRVNSNTQEDAKTLRWTKCYHIQNWPVHFKLDTGADVNCIPLKYVKQMNIPIVKSSSFKVVDYSSNKIQIHGQVRLSCFDRERNTTHAAKFLVVDDSFEPLLGLSSCVAFGLIKRLHSIDSVSEFPSTRESFVDQNIDVFDGLGKFPGLCTIVLKEGSVPTLHYKKRIPLSLHDRLKVELSAMVEQNIISPVDYPTDWVNNMQIVEKPNGSLRICLDPKPLNACIKREHFLIPKSEDILSRLSGKRVFTVLDLRNGFWQMELDRSSSDLTTFMTPFGRFRWNRVPFGISNAPEMFQKRTVKIFGDIPGVEVYFDDVLIAGTDFNDHDTILTLVLERARINNIKFNPSKTQYRSGKVKFMGHIISEGYIEPDSSYIQAIVDMPKPTNRTEVLRLLGLFKYLGKFIPNLSRRTAALRNLTRNDVQWSWHALHDQEYNDILQSITQMPILATFDPSAPITIQTDSSKDGLGSVILQNGLPIAYASRTLSKSEQKWAQIEKELLAIVFACERFHHFLYGRDFKVESDHKPLESLIKRDIDDVTPRLQRMFLYLLKYPGMTIQYTPGKEMLIADCLSRAPLPDDTDFSKQLSGMIHSISQRVCLSSDNRNLYIETLNNDVRYKQIVDYVERKWPPYSQLDDVGKLFHKYREDLHFENGLLFKDHRLVVPTLLQSKIAKWFHAPHFGIEKTLARARSQFFWPGMSNDIAELVKGCEICEKFTRNIQKESLLYDSPPEYPFYRVGIDLFEYGGHDFVALIDSYSGFVVSEMLREKSARHVIDTLDRIFCRYGYPTTIKCDNVPFNSSAFDDYANKCNIEFIFSSPRYPQSNGLAEKGVSIAKNILKRCYEMGDRDSFQYRLLEYNTTPVSSMGLTPSQLFFGRQLKARLPIASKLLKRNNLNEEDIDRKIDKKRSNQKRYYDRLAKDLPVLNVGDKIIFKKNGKEWHYGQVTRKVNERSYIIRDYFGNHFRRNRRFISRSQNEGFNSSDQLFEENFERSKDQPQHPIIVPPHLNTADNTVNDSDQLTQAESDHSLAGSPNSSIYYDADQDSFESDNEPQMNMTDTENHSPPNSDDDNVPYRTRSGRVVRPPSRYND